MNFKKGYSLSALVIGLAVLFVSVSRAGVEILAQENNDIRVRIEPIELTIYHKDGTTEPVVYRVPEVNTLSNNPFYGFKKLRDYLWLMFSQGNLNKAKVSLLLADKKISEAIELIKNNNTKLALEAGSEALDKLKYADTQLNQVDDSELEKKDVFNMMYHAGYAYKEVMVSMENEFEIDKEKLNQIIEELDQFNEQKKQEKEAMEAE